MKTLQYCPLTRRSALCIYQHASKRTTFLCQMTEIEIVAIAFRTYQMSCSSRLRYISFNALYRLHFDQIVHEHFLSIQFFNGHFYGINPKNSKTLELCSIFFTFVSVLQFSFSCSIIFLLSVATRNATPLNNLMIKRCVSLRSTEQAHILSLK